MKHEPFNESTEMYLKTAVELTNGSGDLVPISALAERLGVSVVSATEMVHRLQKQGLLAHTPYKGIALTPDGVRQATALIRSHHLWERFLWEKLDFAWEEVHDLACRLEHATDTAVTERLAVFLGQPTTCPHGNPTPDADGRITPPDDTPLTELKPGQSGQISRIFPESNLLLNYLAARNLKPKQVIIVQEIAPFNGPIGVLCCAEIHHLGPEIAAHIFIKVAGGK